MIKALRNAFIALRMLGVFGFILVSAVAIIGVSVYNIFLIDEGIIEIHQHSQRRFALEHIEYHLLNQELVERAYLLHPERSAELIERFEANGEELDAYVNQLYELDGTATQIEIVEKDVATIQADFEEIRATADTGEYDEEVVNEVFQEEAGMSQVLDDLVFNAEVGLEEDIDALNRDNQRATLIGIIGLILFPMLAIWAFLVASQLTQPLLQLTNAVVAVGGGHYRIELLDNVLKRRDALGKLAHKIDEMADTVAAREVRLQAEADNLQAQLNDARRRKLVLTSAVRPREDE